MRNTFNHKAWALPVIWVGMWALGLGSCAFAADERAWRDRKGVSVEGTFLKLDEGTVYLKRKDGQTVQAKLENLCQEDRTYVKDLTYVPREVVAVFKKHVYKDRFDEEVGESPAANVRDAVALRTVEGVPGAAPEPAADTTWKVVSVDRLGSRLLPRNRAVTNEWATEGVFLFVTYTVKNDTQQPVTVTHPLLSDTQGRKYVQAERAVAAMFIPEGTLFAGRDSIPSGGAKLFCSIYEIAQDSIPAALEVYPSKTSPHFVRKFETRGKAIVLDDDAESGSPVR